MVKLLALESSEVNVDDELVSVELNDECDEWEDEVVVIGNSPDEVLNGNGGGVGMLGNGGREKSSESSANTRPGLIIREFIAKRVVSTCEGIFLLV